ncbi:MAG: O-antigen ligase family protein, partial [Polyangia bacterium]
ARVYLMFILPGVLLLLVFIYARPQEFIPVLRDAPLLYLFFALALLGLAIDLKLRKIRPIATPQLLWVGIFFGWCLISIGVRAPWDLVDQAVVIAISIVLYLLIGHGVQTFRGLKVLATALLAITLYLSFIGVQQNYAPFGCFQISASSEEMGVYDGRACERERDCYANDPEPGADYMCERVGLFGTSSIGGGRVRYLGPLMDPNELALAIGIGLPFAFALFERKRSATRAALLLFSLALVGMAVTFTESRGGVLVVLAVLGVYFIRRFGWKGALLGVLAAAPILLFGGRHGAEAESSSLERLECWYEGVLLFRQYPIFGVGPGQFVDHYYLTAHNSYVLAPAELGFPGMVIWSVVMYLSAKIPVSALRRLSPAEPPRIAPGPEADVARTWAVALLAALAGLLVGVFFLSFCYHQVLWIYVGLAGAYYCALKRHDPEWEVRFSFRELLFVVAGDAFLIPLIYLYARHKVG